MPTVMRDLTFVPDDQPGWLARLGSTAGSAGINIEGISAFTGQGKGIVHVLVADAQAALETFADAGFQVRAAREVVVVDIEDRPGSMADVLAQVTDAGCNVEQAYTAGFRLVMVVDQPEAARAAITHGEVST